MINFRYHIVTITAIFLALAIGIAMGSTFIDKATVDTLRARLDGLENRLSDTDAENEQLRARLGTISEQNQELAEQGSGQLFQGHLDDVPVMIVAVRGVDTDSLDGARNSIVNAGARFAGTLWVTDRLLLDEPAEQDDLAAVLSLPSGDPTRLLRSLTFRLGSLLLQVSEPSNEPSTPTTDPTLAEEPPLLQALRADGFLDFDPPASAPIDGAILPRSDARYLVVGGPGAEVPDDQFLYPLLRTMTGRGTTPVVAAQAAVGDAADENRTLFVGPIRDDENLQVFVSTVDDLESFAGWAAVVLALEDLAFSRVGHFGIGDGAERLLPAPIDSP